MAFKKLCSYPGCPELVGHGQRFCEKHKSVAVKQQAERHKQYDEHQRNQRTKQFYRSRAWQAARQRALMRDNFLCQDCLKRGRITQADTVHHRVEVSKDWSKRLDVSTLVSLCSSCHGKRHSKIANLTIIDF